MKHITLAALGGLALLIAHPTLAQTLTPPLAATVGSGNQESFLVVDFAPGAGETADQSFAFGYLYNTPAAGQSVTALDMLNALTNPASGTGLTDMTTVYNFGNSNETFVNSFQFQGDSQIGSSTDYWTDWTSPDGINWTAAGTGPEGIALSNGFYDGWRWNNTPNYPGPSPVTPFAAPAVPETSPFALLLLGLPLAFLARRRVRS